MRLPWHRHMWVETTRDMTRKRLDGRDFAGTYEWRNITIITYMCICRNYKQRELQGHVSKEQTDETSMA